MDQFCENLQMCSFTDFPIRSASESQRYKQMLSIPRFVAMHISFLVGNFFHLVLTLSLNAFHVGFFNRGTCIHSVIQAIEERSVSAIQ